MSGLNRRRIRRIGVLAAVFLVWQLASILGLLAQEAVPSAAAVLGEAARLLVSRAFWNDMALTASAWALAVAISVSVGTGLGLLIGSSNWAHRLTRLLIDFLQSVPAIAMLPLLTLVFTANQLMCVIVGCAAAIWPVLVQTSYGVRDVDKVSSDTFAVYQITPLRRLRYLVLPSAWPYVVTGLRISCVVALLMVASAELLAGAPGIGNSISIALSSAALPLMWAYVLLIGLAGLGVNGLVALVERRTLKWHPSQRTVEP